MKKIFLIILLLSSTSFAQKDESEKLYSSFGLDIMVSEGGLGIGGFFNKEFTSTLSGFVDFSFSETKDEKEFEYVDYWGRVYVFGKKNRIFLLPLNFGLKYRLFKDDIVDNFRPYLNFAVGPSIVITTPYNVEFFRSFKYAYANYTIGGYIGVGANFGFDRINSLGVNLRYYLVHFFNEGVEGLEGKFQKDLGGIYLTINFGFAI